MDNVTWRYMQMPDCKCSSISECNIKLSWCFRWLLGVVCVIVWVLGLDGTQRSWQLTYEQQQQQQQQEEAQW